MNELIGLLLAIDWVAVSLFLSAVVILLFVGGICSMFMSKSPSVEAWADLVVQQVMHDAVAKIGGPDFAGFGSGDDEADASSWGVAAGL